MTVLLSSDAEILRSEERTLETVDYLVRVLSSAEARAAQLLGLPSPDAAAESSIPSPPKEPPGRTGRRSSMTQNSEHQRSSMDGRGPSDGGAKPGKAEAQRPRAFDNVELIAGRDGLVQEEKAGTGGGRRRSSVDGRTSLDGRASMDGGRPGAGGEPGGDGPSAPRRRLSILDARTGAGPPGEPGGDGPSAPRRRLSIQVGANAPAPDHLRRMSFADQENGGGPRLARRSVVVEVSDGSPEGFGGGRRFARQTSLPNGVRAGDASASAVSPRASLQIERPGLVPLTRQPGAGSPPPPPERRTSMVADSQRDGAATSRSSSGGEKEKGQRGSVGFADPNGPGRARTVGLPPVAGASSGPRQLRRTSSTASPAQGALSGPRRVSVEEARSGEGIGGYDDDLADAAPVGGGTLLSRLLDRAATVRQW